MRLIRPRQQLNSFSDHAELAALLAGLLVVPLVELEAAIHEQGVTLANELLNDACGLSEGIDVDEGCFFLLLSGLSGPAAGDSQREVGDGSPTVGRLDRWISDDITHEGDLIMVWHCLLAVRVLCMF